MLLQKKMLKQTLKSTKIQRFLFIWFFLVGGFGGETSTMAKNCLNGLLGPQNGFCWYSSPLIPIVGR